MSDFFRSFTQNTAEFNLDGVSDSVIISMGIIVTLLIILSIFALIVSIFLSISYIKYNRRKTNCKMTGEQIARTILDNNGLQNIKIKSTGSIIFGNSYSYYFKKIRLRRLTAKRDSITSLSMAAQKASLAILYKENDPDMKRRIKLSPVIYFGPLAFIPLIIIGAVIDYFISNNSDGKFTLIAAACGLLIYALSFVLSILVLKTEKKAQAKAIEIMKSEGFATDEEIEMSKKLFKLYNIEYINNMIIALLELIYRVLQVVAYFQGSSKSSSN